jgi:hypothetical protein
MIASAPGSAGHRLAPLKPRDGSVGWLDCMKQFKAAWEWFAADEANLTEFLNMKRKRR